MKRYKAATILSLIYCGLGQIYKGQKLKGFSLMIGYSLLLASLILRSSFSYFTFFPVLSIIILMWIMSIIDAYVDDDDPVGVEQSFIWRKLAYTIEIAVICVTLGAIVLISYPELGGNQTIQNPIASTLVRRLERVQRFEKKPEIAETFSIQVAAFKNYEGAVETYNLLTARGYPTIIDYQASSTDNLYRVLVGNFKTEREARTFADRINRLIGLNYIIVSRPANQ